MPKMPRFDYFGLILKDSLIIAVVSFAVALSLGKTFAKKHGYLVRANQEFAALGACEFQSEKLLVAHGARFPVSQLILVILCMLPGYGLVVAHIR